MITRWIVINGVKTGPYSLKSPAINGQLFFVHRFRSSLFGVMAASYQLPFGHDQKWRWFPIHIYDIHDICIYKIVTCALYIPSLSAPENGWSWNTILSYRSFTYFQGLLLFQGVYISLYHQNVQLPKMEISCTFKLFLGGVVKVSLT